MSKLEIAVIIGPESKQFLADLTAQLDRMNTITSPEALTVPKGAKAGRVSKNKAEAEETFDLGDNGEASEAASEKLVTKKDLIAACRDNREGAIKALKKMKVASIHDLKPEQYAQVLNAIGV